MTLRLPFTEGVTDNVAIAPDGRLAATFDDGHIRLYAADGTLIRDVVSEAGQPLGLAFDPEGERLAVGHVGSASVQVYDGRSLEPLAGPDVSDLGREALARVAWSHDSSILYAAGARHVGTYTILAWDGNGDRRAIPAGPNSVTGLHALPGGDLFMTTDGPLFARIGSDGARLRSAGEKQQADFRLQCFDFGLSFDGTTVDFNIELGAVDRVRFDFSRLGAPLVDPPDDGVTAPPKQDDMPVKNWMNGHPALDGVLLPMETRDTAFLSGNSS